MKTIIFAIFTLVLAVTIHVMDNPLRPAVVIAETLVLLWFLDYRWLNTKKEEEEIKMNNLTLTDIVRPPNKVYFIGYSQGELWYKTEDGFEFPVPIGDTGNATFLAEDKAMLFMRWIRKHKTEVEGLLEQAQKAKEETAKTFQANQE